MTEYTIDQDIDFLREIADDMGHLNDFSRDDAVRLEDIACRLEEIEAIMPVVFAYVPPEEIDRALDMLQGPQTYPSVRDWSAP